MNKKYTAIISDLHLCEAEPIHPKFPLWKKFKTREFFFDHIFANFLEKIQKEAHNYKIELVLNGDIFDFDSVVTVPEQPTFRISWLERARGMKPLPEKSLFKIKQIVKDHPIWFNALKKFLQNGHAAIFVIGNHDLELHFENVQEEILKTLELKPEIQNSVRFVEWFYISGGDTLIEHGNQYDPYCVCEDPVSPFVFGYNHKTIKLPFGNLACRYLINGMGFFNPHVDTNYIMSLKDYVKFFVKYIIRAQPFLMLTWLFGSFMTLWYSFVDNFSISLKNPLAVEDRYDYIARKANTSARVVRELRELFVSPARNNPYLIARELWLDRVLLLFMGFVFVFLLIGLIKQIFNISLFWGFIPLFMLVPFFLFYSKSVISYVSKYKEPDERIMSTASAITGVNRIVYGHTHHARHEYIGAVEHLNSGCWSPAFLDVECTKPVDKKTFVWIYPNENEEIRKASLKIFEDSVIRDWSVVHSKK